MAGKAAFLEDNYLVHFVELPGDDRASGPQ